MKPLVSRKGTPWGLVLRPWKTLGVLATTALLAFGGNTAARPSAPPPDLVDGPSPLGVQLPACATLVPTHRSTEAENLYCAPFTILGHTIDSGDIARLLHEWQPVVDQTPVILEGTVTEAGMSSEDNPIAHVTHDFTFHVVPDCAYQNLLGIQVNPQTGRETIQPDIEVEWESGLGADNDDNRCHNANERGDSCGFYSAGHTRGFLIWHWPTVGDWVHVEGIWTWDRGHPPAETEIHPPRLVAVRRHLPFYAFVERARPALPAGAGALLPDRPVDGGGPPEPGTDPPPPSTERVTVLATEADIFASGDGDAFHNNRGRPFEFPNPALYPPHSPFPVGMSEKDYEFDIEQIVPRPSPSAPLRVQAYRDPSDTFPADPEITSFPGGPTPHIHVKIPWRSRGVPDTALFKRALYVYWDEGHGAPASYQPRAFSVRLDRAIINNVDLEPGFGQGDMEYRLFLEVGGRYLFANEIPSVDNILEDGLGDTGTGETWGINQTVLVFMPPAPQGGIDHGFRVHSGGWEADGANEAFDRLLDPTIPEPCSWPYYNDVKAFLTDVLITGENYLAGGRDDPIGERDVTFTNANPPVSGAVYHALPSNDGHDQDMAQLWDDGQDQLDVTEAYQVIFQVIERSLDDVLGTP